MTAGVIGAKFTLSQHTNTAVVSVAATAQTPSYNVAMNAMPEGFVKASAKSTPCVVYITNESTVQYNSPFGWFWDYDPFGSRGKATSTGSGVIVSSDGYIVTNNHVIQGADKLTVVLNQQKKEYSAKVIGTDPASDLALLKIEASDLPAITFANSDEILVGDWVLAVGNPFNLTSTVTAGIVSAKGRNINIVNNQFPIESFIQTDAAINPGNSGGALVNIQGDLVGINTAIQSNTGSYTGYGFAIPANIVNKIVKDFIEFGEVKRAFIGLTGDNISATQSATLGRDDGVWVKDVLEEGPADKAGIKVNDVLIRVNEREIHSKADFDELLAYYRPGETFKMVVLREGKETALELTSISAADNRALMMKGAVNSKLLGADFQPLSANDLTKMGLSNGIRIINIKRAGYINQLGLPEGFIIYKFNGKSYADAEDLIAAMEAGKGRVSVEGMTKEGAKQSFSYYSN
ncbi:MAG: trypsin-like peptidase domain-containing protein [Bacteroidia bacterium]|jgi:Do/DeqQ family serine protease